jgi:hypothetical protein
MNIYIKYSENSIKITEAYTWYQKATIKISGQEDKYITRYHK